MTRENKTIKLGGKETNIKTEKKEIVVVTAGRQRDQSMDVRLIQSNEIIPAQVKKEGFDSPLKIKEFFDTPNKPSSF
jgi:hypothetical protein